MRRSTLCALPYLVAFTVPAAALGALFVADGQSPLYGLFGGVIALLGALLMLVTRLVIRRRTQEAELDEALEWLRKAQESDYDEPPERI